MRGWQRKSYKSQQLSSSSPFLQFSNLLSHFTIYSKMQVSQLLSVVSALSFVALVSGQHAVPGEFARAFPFYICLSGVNDHFLIQTSFHLIVPYLIDVSTYSDQHCQDNKANISPRTQECTSATGSSLYIGNIK